MLGKVVSLPHGSLLLCSEHSLSWQLIRKRSCTLTTISVSQLLDLQLMQDSCGEYLSCWHTRLCNKWKFMCRLLQTKFYVHLRIGLGLLCFAGDLTVKFWKDFKLLAENSFVWPQNLLFGFLTCKTVTVWFPRCGGASKHSEKVHYLFSSCFY